MLLHEDWNVKKKKKKYMSYFMYNIKIPSVRWKKLSYINNKKNVWLKLDELEDFDYINQYFDYLN